MAAKKKKTAKKGLSLTEAIDLVVELNTRVDNLEAMRDELHAHQGGLDDQLAKLQTRVSSWLSPPPEPELTPEAKAAAELEYEVNEARYKDQRRRERWRKTYDGVYAVAIGRLLIIDRANDQIDVDIERAKRIATAAADATHGAYERVAPDPGVQEAMPATELNVDEWNDNAFPPASP